MPFTAAIRNGWLDEIFQGTVHISLHSADPGASGANELSGNGYARVNGTGKFSAAANGSTANTEELTFGPASGSNWAQATHFGLWSAASGGTFKGGFPLTFNQTVQVPNFASFAVGDLTASIT